jgi:VWFA-related protein
VFPCQGFLSCFSLSCFGVLLTAASAGDQTDSGVVLRSDTNLVQVRVAAQDSQGRPVTNLKREDFQIFDNRKPQVLSLFVADRGSPREAVSGGGDARPDAAHDKPSGYALIVLDWINTGVEDQVRARVAALKALDRFTPGQKIALYLLGEHSGLILDFTSDGDDLKDAIDRAGIEMSDVGNPPPGRFDARYGGRPAITAGPEAQLLFDYRRVDAPFRGLNYMGDRLAHLPGMKSLIWISPAFPIVVNGAKPAELVFTRQFEALVAKLNRADVAVYPVDPRGLIAGGGARGYVDTMLELASRTGGTAFFAPQRHRRGDSIGARRCAGRLYAGVPRP